MSNQDSSYSRNLEETKEEIGNEAKSIEEAVQALQEASTANFDESVELHIRLDIDPKKGDQQVRSSMVLPNGTGQDKTVAAFVSADYEDEAKEAGADKIMGEHEIEQIRSSKKIDFDVAVATPDMMNEVAKAGPVLGPRGLMPSPKTGTVSENIGEVIEELKSGKIEFRNDDTGNIHQVVGKVSFKTGEISENIEEFIEHLKRSRPDGVKGEFIDSVYLTTTMGPSVELDVDVHSF
ncbi:MAG: 50S ribosomal protein L1 [Candidatus Magasanikbacteria bacterium]